MDPTLTLQKMFEAHNRYTLAAAGNGIEDARFIIHLIRVYHQFPGDLYPSNQAAETDTSCTESQSELEDSDMEDILLTTSLRDIVNTPSSPRRGFLRACTRAASHPHRRPSTTHDHTPPPLQSDHSVPCHWLHQFLGHLNNNCNNHCKHSFEHSLFQRFYGCTNRWHLSSWKAKPSIWQM